MSTDLSNLAAVVARLGLPAITIEAPCPTWCTTGPHPYEAHALAPNEFYRTHTTLVAETRSGLEIVIDSLESITTHGYSAEPPAVVVRPGDEVAEFTAPAARALAADLVAAASALELILISQNGGPTRG